MHSSIRIEQVPPLSGKISAAISSSERRNYGTRARNGLIIAAARRPREEKWREELAVELVPLGIRMLNNAQAADGMCVSIV